MIQIDFESVNEKLTTLKPFFVENKDWLKKKLNSLLFLSSLNSLLFFFYQVLHPDSPSLICSLCVASATLPLTHLPVPLAPNTQFF